MLAQSHYCAEKVQEEDSRWNLPAECSHGGLGGPSTVWANFRSQLSSSVSNKSKMGRGKEIWLSDSLRLSSIHSSIHSFIVKATGPQSQLSPSTEFINRDVPIPAPCAFQNHASPNHSSPYKETVASLKGRQHCNIKIQILYF